MFVVEKSAFLLFLLVFSCSILAGEYPAAALTFLAGLIFRCLRIVFLCLIFRCLRTVFLRIIFIGTYVRILFFTGLIRFRFQSVIVHFLFIHI